MADSDKTIRSRILEFIKPIRIFFSFTIYQNYIWPLKDNLPHNTCQIYVKPHSKSTQMTLDYHIFDEKALE